MFRPPVAVVVPVWNVWEETRACLEALVGTLGPRDRLVVVDAASTDATPHALRRLPRIEHVRLTENRGWAASVNVGLEATDREFVVVVDNDATVGTRWLEPLLAPFSDPAVAATGPRSDTGSGTQRLELGLPSSASRAVRRRVGQARALETAGPEIVPVERLDGFCLALRRSAVRDAGGLDEGFGLEPFAEEALAARLVAAGHRLCVVRRSFVAHSGQATFSAMGLDYEGLATAGRERLERLGVQTTPEPLVSACLIVRDEEDHLPGCLGSIRPFVDEIVVHDTGSEDGTVALARDLGATVIEGEWHDDFARARNEALGHCHGRYVFWLDADERLVGDPAGARRRLASDQRAEGFWVTIENARGAGLHAHSTHVAGRVFRREVGHWAGRIHEQVWLRDDSRPLELRPIPELRLEHLGYLTRHLVGRDKATRNIHLARLALEDATDSAAEGRARTHLARSLMLNGQLEEALSEAERALAASRDILSERLSLKVAADALLGLGRLDDARRYVRRLRRRVEHSGPADAIEAEILRREGHYAEALALFESLARPSRDDLGAEYGPSSFATERAACLAALGEPALAAELLLSVLGTEGTLDTHLGTIVEYLDAAGAPLSPIPAHIPPDERVLFLAQAVQLTPEVADRVLEACHEAWSDPATLAAAAGIADQLSPERALEWSLRLRQAGQAGRTPLARLADRTTRSDWDRALSGVLAWRLFGEAVEGPLAETLPRLSGAEREQLSRLLATMGTAPGPATARGEGSPSAGSPPPVPVGRVPADRSATERAPAPTTAEPVELAPSLPA